MTQLTALPEEAIVAAQLRSRVTEQALRLIQRLWNRHRPPEDLHAWFEANIDVYGDIIQRAQLELAALAASSTDSILAVQGYQGPTELTVDPEAFAGVDVQGRDVRGVFYAQALKVAEELDNAESSSLDVALAWTAAANGLLLMSQTIMSDTSRNAKIAQMHARPGTKYIRLVRPPCCARCAILAGKVGGENMDFKRHPGCDCDAIPVADFDDREDTIRSQGWMVDPKEYFDSLSEKEQNLYFTKAGAQAIRDGADIGQVINSRRGMNAHGVFSTEGTTKRGWASQYLREQYKAKMTKQGGRYRRTSRKRLSIAEIYRRADNPDEALSMLHANGYLTDASPDLSGKYTYFLRDAEVKAAKQQVAHARRAEAQALARTQGSGGGKPPEPPRIWRKSGGGDDEIRRQYFQDLATADRTVPIEHIVYGKVRRNRIEGAHDYERLGWIREKIDEGMEISLDGKTLFPQLQGKTQALIEWLGGPTHGVISDTLDDPDEIHLVKKSQRELRKSVISPDEHKITLIIHIGPTRKSDPASFRIATAYPQRGGQGILDEKDIIEWKR